MKSIIMTIDDVYRIDPEKEITLHFSVILMDGTVIDSTRDKSPATFRYGDGSLLPGFEKSLIGLKAGDKRSVIIEAANGFGERNEENMQEISRNRFGSDMVLEEGSMISFANAGDSGELPGAVHKIDGDSIIVDLNHPLSGRDLTFDVEIIDVKPAAQIVQMQGGVSNEN